MSAHAPAHPQQQDTARQSETDDGQQLYGDHRHGDPRTPRDQTPEDDFLRSLPARAPPPGRSPRHWSPASTTSIIRTCASAIRPRDQIMSDACRALIFLVARLFWVTQPGAARRCRCANAGWPVSRATSPPAEIGSVPQSILWTTSLRETALSGEVLPQHHRGGLRHIQDRRPARKGITSRASMASCTPAAHPRFHAPQAGYPGGKTKSCRPYPPGW